MSKRNNIEDFFNNSLEGFDGQPSEQVWSGIEEMLEVKVPFWKTWKFWAWFAGASTLFICLMSYQLIMKQKMNTLVTQNTILLEQNKLLIQEVEQTQIILKQTKEEKQSVEKVLNNVKVAAATEEKIRAKASKGKIAKEQSYFTSAFAKEQLDFSISGWIDNRRDASISTFGEANRIREKRRMDSLWQRRLEESIQESVVNEQSGINKKSVSSSIESKVKLADETRTNTLSLKPLDRVLQNQYFLPNADPYQRTNLAIVKGSYIDPIEMKLKKPAFTPSLRLGLTGGVFTSISNIPNSVHVANNSGLVLQWQAFRNWGFAGSLRYNELTYEIFLDANNQDFLQRYPKTENINLAVEIISATHHYVDLPMGIIWKIPIGDKDNKLYINPSIAWQFYLPQTFEYETVDNTTIITQNNRLYAYFGSTTLHLGYEQKIKNNLRLQMGVWTESSFVEYGLDNRSGTNIGASATLVFGK